VTMRPAALLPSALWGRCSLPWLAPWCPGLRLTEPVGIFAGSSRVNVRYAAGPFPLRNPVLRARVAISRDFYRTRGESWAVVWSQRLARSSVVLVVLVVLAGVISVASGLLALVWSPDLPPAPPDTCTDEPCFNLNLGNTSPSPYTHSSRTSYCSA
jgi:hypothetical protein